MGCPPTSAVYRHISLAPRIPEYGWHGVMWVCICGIDHMREFLVPATGKSLAVVAGTLLPPIASVARLGAIPCTSPVPPLILLSAPNEAKPAQRTVRRHGTKWCIPKHDMTPQDPPKVPVNSQQAPRTCWACDPNAPTTPCPYNTTGHSTTSTPQRPCSQRPAPWIAPWFHHTHADTTVAWDPRHTLASCGANWACRWLRITTPLMTTSSARDGIPPSGVCAVKAHEVCDSVTLEPATRHLAT